MAEGKGHFGEWVRWSRARKGMNRLALAEALSVSSKTITNLERKDSPEGVADTTISALSRVFGVEEPDILEGWNGVRFDIPPADYAALADVAKALSLSVSETAKNLTLKGLTAVLGEVRRAGAIDLGSTTMRTGEGGTSGRQSRLDTPGAAATPRLPPEPTGPPVGEPAAAPKPKVKPRRRKAG